mgnify:CR=1 FL=1
MRGCLGRREGAECVCVRSQDIPREPVARCRDICERLGVTGNDRVEELVRETSDTSNPVEASRPDSVRRDSAAHISNWKRRLTADEIARVRAGTEHLWTEFYDDRDW